MFNFAKPLSSPPQAKVSSTHQASLLEEHGGVLVESYFQRGFTALVHRCRIGVGFEEHGDRLFLKVGFQKKRSELQGQEL